MFEGGFTDEGARIFLRVFDETMRFAEPPKTDKLPDNETLETNNGGEKLTPDQATISNQAGGRGPKPLEPPPAPPAGTRRAVFTLDEGDVSLTFPSDLSADGFQELKEYLDIFLRKAQRQKADETKDAD